MEREDIGRTHCVRSATSCKLGVVLEKPVEVVRVFEFWKSCEPQSRVVYCTFSVINFHCEIEPVNSLRNRL
jgi:hypothetical protein